MCNSTTVGRRRKEGRRWPRLTSCAFIYCPSRRKVPVPPGELFPTVIPPLPPPVSFCIPMPACTLFPVPDYSFSPPCPTLPYPQPPPILCHSLEGKGRKPAMPFSYYSVFGQTGWADRQEKEEKQGEENIKNTTPFFLPACPCSIPFLCMPAHCCLHCACLYMPACLACFSFAAHLPSFALFPPTLLASSLPLPPVCPHLSLPPTFLACTPPPPYFPCTVSLPCLLSVCSPHTPLLFIFGGEHV